MDLKGIGSYGDRTECYDLNWSVVRWESVEYCSKHGNEILEGCASGGFSAEAQRHGGSLILHSLLACEIPYFPVWLRYTLHLT
jgi:hypothetical protein